LRPSLYIEIHYKYTAPTARVQRSNEVPLTKISATSASFAF